MSNFTPTLAQLQRGLQISQQIAALEAELQSLFSGAPAAKAAAPAAAKAAPASKAKKKGGMSDEGRANIIAAQKARWAKIKSVAKKGKAPVAKQAAAPKAEAPKVAKRKPMSAEAKARLGALMRARWAAAKAGTGPAPTTPKS